MRGVQGNSAPICEIPAALLDDFTELCRQVSERGQTEHEFFIDYDSVRYRVARADTIDGPWFALRRALFPIPDFNTFGLHQQIYRYLAHLGRHHHGLIIFAGETGQGKTTTACSLLQKYLTSYGDVAVTVEDPPELPLQGNHGEHGCCWQLQVHNGDFGRAMERTMRYNPRYILLGEVRGAVEASEALRAAINGHLVLTTIHAGSVQGAINSLIKKISGKEPVELARSILADGLAGVIHQKLVRSHRGRSLRISFLFPGASSGIRAKIRDGKLEQLGTDIEAQANRVLAGKAPTGE